MPHDFIKFEYAKKPESTFGDRRIYVCEDGNIRVEERHFRQTFSAEEFVALLRQIFNQKEREKLRIKL